MLTIGPWWLYDAIICFFAFLILMASIRNGLFVGLYFLLFAVFTYLMLTFIPQLIANALSPMLIGLLKRSSIFSSIAKGLDSTLGSVNGSIQSIMDNFGMKFPALTMSGFTEDVGTAIVALFLYLIIFALLSVILFVTMFVIYACIKQKLRAAKINRYVSALCGGVFGAFIAVFFASSVATVLAMPVLDYTSQQIGLAKIPTGESTEDMINDIVHGGNQYKKYAVSGQLANLIPAGTITFSYSSSCAFKYVLAPILTAVTSFKSSDTGSATDKATKVFGGYSDTILEGYATDNIFDLPVKQCIQVLPTESQNIVRLITEFILDSRALSSLESSGTGMRSGGQAYALFDQMDQYIANKYGNQSNYRFDEDGFVDFWNSIPAEDNQFLQSVDALKLGGVDIGSVETIFSDPHSTYKFLRNVYQVNVRMATASSAPFLPSFFTSLYLMQGLEAVPSGLVSSMLGATYDVNNPSAPFDYNFKLGEYMSYVDEE